MARAGGVQSVGLRTDEKSTKIINWLKKMYGDRPVPHYEMNTRNVEILYHLAEWNVMRDRDLTLIIQDTKQKSAEVQAEAKYVQDILADGLGPSFMNLSRMGNNYLNQLVDSCVALELKDSSITSFIPAVNELSDQLVSTESKNEELEIELRNVRKKLTNALVLEKSLEEDLKKAEEQCHFEKAKVEVRSQNMKKLKDKSEEYKYKIQAGMDQLSAAGMEDSLSHRSLVSISETLAELKAQSTVTNEKLKSYLDLTPNPSLVKVKIEEAKRELKATEEELTAKVNMMEFVLPEQGKRRLN
ncbi:HAUS augmin-like complex subunit 1 [Pelobates cultripes]|uniref:HAUS augmin-like complex subunit 1 n=1 Tax=Pelobates cultripes TaxID=61616 RepID=A0AAD1SBB2_PELCU|nr:HAUS augmin-like complex subunit 1 [Pelobates cultripes]CAH2296686.1 HAUS augmin-like complex subunit 1 [Pelobates cultripes]CAH2296687.1 HAUS augmin-like complex subunit 1 [Pelobates cultripes]